MPRLVILGPDDAGEVLTLQRAAYVTEAQAHRDLDLPPLRQGLAEIAAELADPQVVAVGLRDDTGRLLGGVRARVTADDPHVALVARLCVVPDRQGEGHGTRLLAALEELLPPGVERLRLFTGEHSLATLRLYARLGFAETGREPSGAGYDLVHLAKARTVPPEVKSAGDVPI